MSKIVTYAIDLEASAGRSHVASVPECEDRSLALLGAGIGPVEAQHSITLGIGSAARELMSVPAHPDTGITSIHTGSLTRLDGRWIRA
jgi:hypothetical protein